MENGQELTLDQVWYVPGIKKSLLSVGQLDLQGYSTIFTSGAWTIVHGTRLLSRATSEEHVVASWVKLFLVHHCSYRLRK